MPTPCEITTFTDDAPPAGESPWVVAPVPRRVEVVPADERWADEFDAVAARLRSVLGGRVLDVLHVGSTAVPGLDAKPIIDIDVIVANPADETAWLPLLEAADYVLTVREAWWHEHRMLKGEAPACHIHVFGPEAPEPWKHRIFRDHLRRDATDRARYAAVKREAASAHGSRDTGMDYNRRKEQIIRDIYARAFAAAGL